MRHIPTHIPTSVRERSLENQSEVRTDLQKNTQNYKDNDRLLMLLHRTDSGPADKAVFIGAPTAGSLYYPNIHVVRGLCHWSSVCRLVLDLQPVCVTLVAVQSLDELKSWKPSKDLTSLHRINIFCAQFISLFTHCRPPRKLEAWWACRELWTPVRPSALWSITSCISAPAAGCTLPPHEVRCCFHVAAADLCRGNFVCWESPRPSDTCPPL